jgi:DNA mismatch repair protein MutS2
VRTQGEKTPEVEAIPAAKKTGRPIEEGSYVRVSATGAEGTVIEIRDKRAVVEIGGVRMQVSTKGLESLERPKPANAKAARGGWTAPDTDASPEVDMRGMRADEAITRLQHALDAAVQSALPSLRIIHGKGTGALRELVQDVLKTDPRIASSRPGGVGEGGTGVTVAELR